MNRKYPIGDFNYDAEYSAEDTSEWIEEISLLPKRLYEELKDISEEQLDTAYREGGWTVRQVVHHLADSHLNAFIRVKLALTEENPTIKPYNEQAWATLGDYEEVPVDEILVFIKVLHAKWIAILKQMSEKDFSRTFLHPEANIKYTLSKATAMYAWHSNHHLAHIQLVTQSPAA